MLGHTDVDAAIEVVQAVSDVDDLFALRRRLLLEPVDRPVRGPIPDEARGLAGEPRIVLRRAPVEGIGRFLAFRRVDDFRPRRLRGLHLLQRDLAGRESRRQALRNHGAVAAARGNGEHELLHGPVAADVRLAVGQAQRALRGIDGRLRLELIVAIELGRIADLEVFDVAGVGIRAMRTTLDLHVRARLEHLGGPTGTHEQRGRTHFAPHVRLLAVLVDHVDLHVGVRVDQVHLGEGSGPLLQDVHLEETETVVSQRRGGQASESRNEDGRPREFV